MDLISLLGFDDPGLCVVLFILASLLMVWRTEALLDNGFEGTAVGTLVTPYCSGLGNLIFVFLVLRERGDPAQVVTNCLVNNLTNLTVLLAVPALFWGLQLGGGAASKSGRGKRSSAAGKREIEQRISRISLGFTLGAAAFFAIMLWVLGSDGLLDANDGLVLCGLFVFWQAVQLTDVLKHSVRNRSTVSALILIDLCVLLLAAWMMYASLDWLVHWLGTQKSGFIRAENLGWLSGWLMVLPNAVLALYYGFRGRADVAYASQVGDGHICIPLCVGLCAAFKPLRMPPMAETALLILAGTAVVHLLLLVFVRGLPRWTAWPLLAAYGVFLWAGLG